MRDQDSWFWLLEPPSLGLFYTYDDVGIEDLGSTRRYGR
jgi:hypothetical protein